MPQSILVVDDDQTIAELLTELLATEGYRVRRAFDGDAALTEIAREVPDVVVADVVMPQADGLTLVRQLRTQRRGIPVVLVSGVYDYVDVPGVHFLPKPFELDELLGVIARVLAPQESTVKAP